MNATGSAGPDRRHAALVGLAVAVTILSGWTTWLEVAGSPVSGFRMAELWVAVGDDLGAGPPGWVGVADSTADATSVGFGTWLAGAAGCAQAIAGIVSAWTRR